VTTAFFDSSAFVKLLVEEDGSEHAERIWNEADVVVASRVALPEVGAALAAARRAARLDEASLRVARREWRRFWEATDVIELTDAVATDAAALAGRLVLGGADAVHLASVRMLQHAQPVLVTWDRRLAVAALSAGVSVTPPDDDHEAFA
jgi:predicted nucleic acid-binding protein